MLLARRVPAACIVQVTAASRRGERALAWAQERLLRGDDTPAPRAPSRGEGETPHE